MIRHHLTNLINKKSDKDQKTIIRKKKKKEKETKKKKKVHLTKNKTNNIRVRRDNFSHNSLISCFPTSIKHSFLQHFHLCYLFFLVLFVFFWLLLLLVLLWCAALVLSCNQEIPYLYTLSYLEGEKRDLEQTSSQRIGGKQRGTTGEMTSLA